MAADGGVSTASTACYFFFGGFFVSFFGDLSLPMTSLPGRVSTDDRPELYREPASVQHQVAPSHQAGGRNASNASRPPLAVNTVHLKLMVDPVRVLTR